ncbi:MAG TPA: GDSL-type esterase/lipase family protein [Chitinophagaceae bacterium]|nr:GDSL-type esterase/lipase family protein [Chitinophagaceae bacterium]
MRAFRQGNPFNPFWLKRFKQLLHSAPVIPETPVRLACIGDSITYGDRIEGREMNSYPSKLQGILGKDALVMNFGVNGCTLLKKGDLPYWEDKTMQLIWDFNPHIAVLMLGTNDAKARNWKYHDEFYGDYIAFIRYLKGIPARPLIWACFPVPAFGPMYDILPEVIRDQEIPLIRKASRAEQIKNINLYRALSGYPDLFPDLVHPNAAGAQRIAVKVYSAVRKYFKGSVQGNQRSFPSR